MKKPFVFLNRPSDIIKLIVCITLCACAIMLFVNSGDESVAVFANGNDVEDNSLYGLVGRII